MASIFTIARSQSLKWINLADKSDMQTYDNRFDEELQYAHTLPYAFCPRRLQSDGLWFQYRTNYSAVNVYLVDEDNNKTLLTSSLEFIDSSSRKYYNVDVNISAITGNYYLECVGADSGRPTFLFQSETFEIVDEYDDSILIEWFGNDSYNDQIYWTDKKQSIRVEGYDRDLLVEQSKSVYDNTDYAPITLKSKPIRQTEVVINRTAFWVIERINLGLSHDEFYVQGVQYNTGDVIEAEKLTDSRLYKGVVTLTQLDYEDGEDTEITGEIEQAYIAFNDLGDRMLYNDLGDYAKANN